MDSKRERIAVSAEQLAALPMYPDRRHVPLYSTHGHVPPDCISWLETIDAELVVVVRTPGGITEYTPEIKSPKVIREMDSSGDSRGRNPRGPNRSRPRADIKAKRKQGRR